MQRGDDIVAIEAKSGRQTPPTDCRRLRAHAGLPQLRRRIVVYSGKRPQRAEDGIEILPIGSSTSWHAVRILLPDETRSPIPSAIERPFP